MVTREQLSTLYPSASDVVLDAFADQAGKLFQDFGISANSNRLQYFLAQIGHESDGLTISAENLNYRAQRLTEVWPKRFPTLAAAAPYAGNPEKLGNYVYANRMGNGPPESGDGWRFRGQGFIQITGREAYKELGAAAGLDLVNKPEVASAPDSALLVACSFWKWKKLNPVCDKADFKRVTEIINGGLNGYDDRLAWLDKVRRTLGTPTEELSDPGDPQLVIAVQKALRAKGYTEVGAADGLVGPRTKAAIRHFRQKTGLPDGDSIDLALVQALGVQA